MSRRSVLGHIPVFRPGFGEEELAAVNEVFRSGWIGPGPRVAEFEERFSKRVKARHCIAVSSCTAALHLSCLALDLGPGDEVLLPAITFISCAHVITQCGATPVFVDVDARNCLIDLVDLERRITTRSRAILAVHYGGNSAAMRQIARIASRHGLAVVEDAAHACGASTPDGPVGNNRWSDFCCFSFNAVKNLSTGDGGIITTRDSQFARRLRKLRWLGIDRGTYDRVRTNVNTAGFNYHWNYSVEETGFKYTMNDIAAAIGLVQLAKLDQHQECRKAQADDYGALLSGFTLVLPQEVPNAVSSWHLYAVRTARRDDLAAYLAARNIATSVHYKPLHCQPCHLLSQVQPELPVAERLGQTLLTLPLHHNLTRQEVRRVAQSIGDFESLSRIEKDCPDG